MAVLSKYETACARVATVTTLIPSGTFAISSAFSIGAKKRVAPAFRADAIFSFMPPIGPTTPRTEMVPVPAIWPVSYTHLTLPTNREV